MSLYRVLITSAGAVVHDFEAISSSSTDCVMQHLDLAPEGAKVEVVCLVDDSYDDRRIARAGVSFHEDQYMKDHP